MNYEILEGLFVLGGALFLLGVAWFLFRSLRSPRRFGFPIAICLIGLGLAVAPTVYTRLIETIDLGERERMVDGELHLTLTGWDRDDYSILADKPETVVLQMANLDVTDRTLEFLRSMPKLRELDLDGSSISDAGLEIIADLETLQILRVGNTAISDEGFQRWLMELPQLRRLNLAQAAVSDQTIETWRNAGEGRRVLR